MIQFEGKKEVRLPMERDEIIIRNAIMHILDSYIGMPVLSDSLLELGPDLNEFLRGHIYKVASSDELKSCVFDEGGSDFYQLIQNFSEDNLVSISKEIATKLYQIMVENIDIRSADLCIVTYQYESIIHLAVLKMNYKDCYVHMTHSQEGLGNNNDIIKHSAALPASSSKLSEAVLINLSDYSVQIVERKYDINGQKINYLSELFLQCHAKMSSKTKFNLVKKAVDEINKKYYEGDLGKQMEAKSVIHNEYQEQGLIQPEVLGDKLFGTIPEIKEEFTEKLSKYNLHTEEVRPQNQTTTKRFEKQYLTTDTGIEINIPMEEYDNNHIEFITNADGTISVLIKNINQITSK